MARRKRASMREGPLADLFRSTVPEEGEEEPTKQQPVPEAPSSEESSTFFDREQEATPTPAAEPPVQREPEPEPAPPGRGGPEPEPGPPAPEGVRADRVDDLADIPAPKERLSRIFADDSHDIE